MYSPGARAWCTLGAPPSLCPSQSRRRSRTRRNAQRLLVAEAAGRFLASVVSCVCHTRTQCKQQKKNSKVGDSLFLKIPRRRTHECDETRSLSARRQFGNGSRESSVKYSTLTSADTGYVHDTSFQVSVGTFCCYQSLSNFACRVSDISLLTTEEAEWRFPRNANASIFLLQRRRQNGIDRNFRSWARTTIRSFASQVTGHRLGVRRLPRKCQQTLHVI